MRQAAVTIVLFPSPEDISLIFIRRSARSDDHHSGQISFPGGKLEEDDTNLQETALRELKEETGVLTSHENVLGELSPLYIPVSNFNVQPFVIGLSHKPQTARQESEVADIFSFSLTRLLKSQIEYKTLSARGYRLKDVPYYNLDGRTLWGATAMITNEFLSVVRSIG